MSPASTYYGTPDSNSLNFSRRYTSDSITRPSANLILYFSPDIHDCVPQYVIKSSAVFIRPPALFNLKRRWSAACLASYSVPFLTKRAGILSTALMRDSIFSVSLSASALTTPSREATISNHSRSLRGETFSSVSADLDSERLGNVLFD